MLLSLILQGLTFTLIEIDGCHSYTSECTGPEELVFLHACSSSTQEVMQDCEFKGSLNHIVRSSFKKKETKLNFSKACLMSSIIATLSILQSSPQSLSTGELPFPLRG